MTCPHCGFLMSPLDKDCARCLHRGYVPPAPSVSSAPNPCYAAPLPASAPTSAHYSGQAAWHGLWVVLSMMGVAALCTVTLFGLVLRERRVARQQAEIAALRAQLAEAQQQVQPPTIIETTPQTSVHIQLMTPGQTVYVPTYPLYPVYDPVAEHARLHHDWMLQQQWMLHQQTEDMMRRQEATMERMRADMQRTRNRMESMRLQSQSRVRDLRDPFNPYQRF